MADGEWLSPRQLSALSYEEQQAYIRQTLEESQEEISDNDSIVSDEALRDIGGDDSDVEEPTLPEYDPVDDSDSDEELEDAPIEPGECFTARDGNVWSSMQPQPVRFRTYNILRSAESGPVRATQGLTIAETFQLIMSDEICDIIICESNRKARQFYDNDNAKHPTREPRSWSPIKKSEFDAYLGLLLLSGVTHSGYVHTKDLWKTTSHPLYRAAMSVQRYSEISRFIRFDNANTRQQRKQTDKAAAVADVFLILNKCLRRYYVAGANITVDKQLYAYRGGTGFTQYIPSIPAKYGIKIWWVCDSISSYPLQGQIYTGLTPSDERERNVGERVVRELCVNLFDGSGRNIVCDKFFTSYNLAKSLMIDNNLSILGTCNKRRTFVPAAFANPKRRGAESSMFGFCNHVTMCSYMPKKNKTVVMLSTTQNTTETAGPKKKPLLILDYNKTKGGVENMDKCLSEFSTKRRTNRWPLAFFYNMLDVAAFAAYVIYIENNTHLKASTSRRRMFLHQLSEQLCKTEMEIRANNSRISRVFSTRNAMEAMKGGPIRVVDAEVHEAEERDSTGRLKVKGNCYICSKRRPTRKACTLCNKPVCAEHSKDMPQCNRCI